MEHGMNVRNMAVAVGVCVVLLGAMSTWTSRINATFFFGRTVGLLARSGEKSRSIARRYVVFCWLAALSCLGVVFLGWRFGSKTLLMLSVVLFTVAQQVAFARAHGEAKALAVDLADEGVVEVALGEAQEQSRWWAPGVAAILAPVAVTVIAFVAAVLLAGRGQAATLKQHVDALASGWDNIGSANMLGFGLAFVMVGAGMLLVFRVSARLRTRMAQYTLRSSLMLAWMGSVILMSVFVCSLRQVVISPATARGVMAGFAVLAVGTLLWNQWRSKQLVPAAVELHGDERWRWGLYYWNPGDPALFVQRRTGMGFTLNYGKAWAWVITVGFVGYFVAMMALVGRK
jgi:uncharacterized membrane protein